MLGQILVGQNIAYSAKVGGGVIAGVNELNLLDTGALAMFTEDMILVTNANKGTVLVDKQKVIIAVGNQLSAGAGVVTAKTYLSVPIPRGQGFMTYEKVPYVAPVLLTKFVGNDGTIGALNMPTFVSGAIASIKIIDTTPGLRTIGAVEQQEIFRYNYESNASDSNLTIITKLIAKINADPNRIVNATVVGSQVGINLTAIAFGTTFSIALDDALVGATVEQPEGSSVGSSVAMKIGVGTSDQILAIEDLYSVERGKTSRQYFATQYYSNPSLVVSGTTYNQYTMQWNDNRSMPLGAQQTSRFIVNVAAPAAGTQETILEAVFLAAFNASQAVESGI